MAKDRKWKRKIYLINKPLQFSYMGTTIWILLLGIILVGTLTYYITMNTLLTRVETVENLPFAMHQLIRDINSTLFKTIGVVFISLIVFAAAFEIIHLHRIAGPMHRIEKVLEELSQGKRVGPIRLRKKDFFQNIAESLNKVMKFYNERDEKVQTILKEAKKLPELKEKIAEIEPFFPDSSNEG